MTIGIHCDERLYGARLQYTLAFLAAHPLAQSLHIQWRYNPPGGLSDIDVGYGDLAGSNISPHFHIPAQCMCFQSPRVDAAFHALAYQQDDRRVYGIGAKARSGDRPLLIGRRFQMDVFENIFFHISRYEEIFSDAGMRDPSGWLREEEHWLVKHKLEDEPVVDILVALLLRIWTGRGIGDPLTTFDLSHDIDFLYRFDSAYKKLRALGGALIHRTNGASIGALLSHYWKMYRGEEKDPYDTFNWLLSEQDHFTAKTLYLPAGGRTRYDRFYSLDHPKVAELTTEAQNKGYRIGLHPSYDAAYDLALFAHEQQRLENLLGHPVDLSRQHWLRFDWELTPSILADRQIREDASLGYRRRLGFRCGTGFPYQLYDFTQERPHSWTERPLVLMDSSALHQAAREQRLPGQLLSEFLKRNEKGTHLSMNFHNSNFDPLVPTGPELRDFYRQYVLKSNS